MIHRSLHSDHSLPFGYFLIALLPVLVAGSTYGGELPRVGLSAAAKSLEANEGSAFSFENTDEPYTIKLDEGSQLTVKTYTGAPFLGQAIKDPVFDVHEILVVVGGLSQGDYNWSLADISGTKKVEEGVFQLTKGDLEYAEAKDGDKLTVQIAEQTTTIATYRPGEIRTWQDLQAMRQHLDYTYTLMNDIIFPDEDNNGIGDYNFIPIGSNITSTNATRFTGGFIGNGHTINKLYIHYEALDYIGLFGYMGSASRIRGPQLINAVVSGNSYVGSLAGCSDGIVEGGYSVGRITGINDFVGGFVGCNYGFFEGRTKGQVIGAEAVGGLIGANDGLVLGHALTGVRGTKGVGGLVGVNSGSVSGYAKNDVMGGESAGGLIGENVGTVDGYATGNVAGEKHTGGLVGLNSGKVTGYSTGRVMGSATATGGLVGKNIVTGFVMGYALGEVSGVAKGVGGLVGINKGDVLGYAIGAVKGGSDVGGLVGFNTGYMVGYAMGNVMGSGDVGGFVGTTFGPAIGYAAGRVTGGIYAGGFVGSDFSSFKTVGYWNIKATTPHSFIGDSKAVDVHDGGNLSSQDITMIGSEKYEKNGSTSAFEHPLFARFFESSAKKNSWPKLKEKIVIREKSYNFVYPQLP